MKRLAVILFGLALLCLLPAQNAPLTLTAPNGGEVWNSGGTYPITWTSVNLTGPVSLQLVGGNNPAAQTIQIAQGIPVEAGEFSWTIPAAMPASATYKVKIWLPSSAGTVWQDLSDGFFTIQGGTDPPPPPQYAVTVLTPNGGEEWPVGSTQAITWNFSGITGEVYIALVGANTNQQLIIAQSVPVAAQNFQWVIPENFAPGSYKAHIVWLTPLAVYVGDLSDGYFQITSTSPPPPPQLQLISPNGGETWVAGTMHPITWSYYGNDGMVQLHLLSANTAAPILIAGGVPAQAGIFHWNIPATIPPGNQYLVRVQLLQNAGTTLFDLSDAPFSLIAPTDPPPPQTYITVTAPNGGEQWLVGSTQNIAWNYGNLEGDVRITLVQGPNTPQIVVAETTPIAAGTFSWTVPDNIPAGQYKVHVQWLGIPAVYWGDLSDGFFSIVNDTPPPPPTLQLISPNGGEIWVAGTPHPINWQYQGPAGLNVLIQLMGGPQMSPIVVIAQGIPAQFGHFMWQIPPQQMPGTEYQVQVQLVLPTGELIADASDACFSIVANNPPPPPLGITVLSPNGGEHWFSGETYPITWSYTGLTGDVYIGLIRENMNSLEIIAPAVPIADEAFNWTVPDNLQPGRYMVQIVWLTDLTVYFGDISNGFFMINVTDPPPPPPQTLTVTAPNGGEAWAKGSYQTITWTDTEFSGNVRIALLYGANNLHRRLIIARQAPNTGSFTWRVPLRLPLGQHYKIAVLKPGGVWDASDGFFSIVAPGNSVSASPNPTTEETRISFDAGENQPVSLRIYNIKGQCVRVLTENRQLSGPQNINWDGRDQQGRKVSAGIYFARIDSPELNLSHRIIMLKK